MEEERGGRDVREEVRCYDRSGTKMCLFFFFFKQKTAYEMCGRDWSSDVCSSDLLVWLWARVLVWVGGLGILELQVQERRLTGWDFEMDLVDQTLRGIPWLLMTYRK